MSVEQAREMPLVDIAYEVLKEANKPFYYRDLLQAVANIRGLSEEEIQSVIAILYTELNIDGRFLSIGNNTWGLKRWYPVDKTAEKTVVGKKFILRDDDDFEEEEDEALYLEDELEEGEGLDYVSLDDEEDLEYEEVDEVDEELEEFDDEMNEEEEEIVEEEDEDY
ncbi:DNA-directed RNA polymerase subunit delta [Effusibacillus lacus]|uniref:DNA-directed RNA polymerase subunit delta n=1 Tax=Effusibacillus lacus TaxID=1348429 RepID=UPI000BB7A620|nr:DNA-directed RNA polymerase subunit delta [Effusibacillus lacus]